MMAIKWLTSHGSISVRLMAATAVSLLAALVLSGVLTMGYWNRSLQMASLSDLVGVNKQAGQLIHDLQRERGLSTVFLNGDAAGILDDLRRQRQASDESLAAVRDATDALTGDSRLADALKLIQASLPTPNALATRRDQVDGRKAGVADMAAFYTAAIEGLLRVPHAAMRLADDAAAMESLLAYQAYQSMKEQAGRERAALGGAFAAGRFTPAQYRAAQTVVANQKTMGRIFDEYATEAHRALAAHLVSGLEVEQADRMRQAALDAGPAGALGVAPAEWMKAATAVIDRMRQVESSLADDLDAYANAAFWDARRMHIIIAVTVGLGLMISAVLALVLMRSIAGSIRGMTGAMRALAAGDTSHPIPSLGHRDEVGQMAGAVEVFRANRIEADRLRAEQDAGQARQLERAEQIATSVKQFERTIADVVGAVSSQSSELEATAKSLSDASEQTSQRSATVAAASEQATQNVQTVAAAALR